MKVWILQTGEPLQIDSTGLRPMRAINLSNALIERGHDVVLWSSDFDHNTKSHRYGSKQAIKIHKNLTIKLIESSGYRSHIGLRRLIDHFELGWNLKKMLKTESPPDIAFIGYPPIEPAWILLRWLSRTRTPSVLDVKDAWPDIFLNKLPSIMGRFGKILLLPYFFMMKSSFKNATGLTSITEDFLDWSLGKVLRQRASSDLVVPLTSLDIVFSENEIRDAEAFWDSLGVRDEGKNRIYFVGTLNDVFDFESAISAAQNLEVDFVIAGDGPQRNDLLAKTIELPNFILPGWISAAQSYVLSKRSQLSFAPIKGRLDYEISIPNKFIDSFRLGKPMVTSLMGVSGNLLIDSQCGILYSAADSDDLTVKLRNLFLDPKRIELMSNNARNLYLEKFEYQKIYGELVDHLAQLARK